MISTTSTPVCIGTNQYPWSRPIPFNPDAPFGAGSLGVLCNSGAVADPTAATQRYLVSPGNYDHRGNAAADLQPIANPSDLGVGYYWLDTALEKADFTLIKPFLVLYSSSGHTALASAASAAGITAKMSFFLIKQARHPLQNEPMEYTAEWKGSAVVTNAANRISSSTRWLPTGAQWCDVATPSTEGATPGVAITADDTDATGGALRLRFDQEGAIGLLTYVSSLTSNAGCGWLRSHM